MRVRRQARESALKVLFQIDLGKVSQELASETVFAEISDDSDQEFAETLINGVISRKDELDMHIEKYSNDWKINRMAGVDRNLLRIAVYEIIHMPEIPVAVSINEAVELAKLYGTDDSSKFINGILGTLTKKEGKSDDQ